MADTVIENLIAKLSFDYDEEQLEKFDTSIKGIVKSLVGVVAAATAAATGIVLFTKKIAESNDELGKFSQRTGISIEALQELGFVAELNGGSIDSMNSSLENLARIASEASRGVGAGVEVFGLLGISVTKSNGQMKEADELFNDVSDSISKLDSQAQRLELSQKLGIGSDLLLSLQKGSEEIKRQRQEARELGFVIDKDAAKAAADFNDESLKLMKVIQGISSAIGTSLMKEITPMITSFIEWFKVNKMLIQQNIRLFLDKVITGIRFTFNILKRVTNVVIGLVNAMGGWKNAIIAVTGLLLTMNASALLMPVLALAAAAGIILILEDLMKFAEGGESAIGNLAEKFPILDSVLRTTLDLLGMIRDGWIAIFKDGELFLSDLIDTFKEFDDFVTRKFFGTLNKLIALLNKIPTIDLINKIFDINIGKAAQIDQAFGRSIEQAATDRASTSQAFAGTTNNNQNNSRIQNVFNIDGGNPDEVRRVVNDVLDEQYSGAQTNLESQVDF